MNTGVLRSRWKLDVRICDKFVFHTSQMSEPTDSWQLITCETEDNLQNKQKMYTKYNSAIHPVEQA